jgi:hypothetical protein
MQGHHPSARESVPMSGVVDFQVPFPRVKLLQDQDCQGKSERENVPPVEQGSTV